MKDGDKVLIFAGRKITYVVVVNVVVDVIVAAIEIYLLLLGLMILPAIFLFEEFKLNLSMETGTW